MTLAAILSTVTAARRWFANAGKARILVIGCAIVVLALLASYCAGTSHGASAERSKMTDSLRKVLADSSRIIEKRLAQRAPIIQQASARVDTVRVRYTDAKARVQVVSDTLLRIDSLVVPTMPPIAERIRSSDSLVVALDSLNKLQAAHLVDLTLDRNAWRSRALLDEANTAKASKLRTVLRWVEIIGAGYIGYRVGRGR